MTRRKIPFSMKLLLFLLFFFGFAFNVLIILDVAWLNRYLTPRRQGSTGSGTFSSSGPEGPMLDRLREGILLVLVPKCDGNGASSGTGFVVEPGYVATAAHVISDHYACDSEIQVVDSYSVSQAAIAVDYSEGDDLALLQISDTAIPPLTLADSRNYQEVNERIEVITIGYPLVGTASGVDRAAVSGEGNISSFDAQMNRFVTSGLNVNPGNSGGPVFLVSEDWKVIGIASAKLNVTVGEGIGYVIPINLFKSFFTNATGEALE